MKKKKLLFIMESLKIGGAEKSLVTIFSLLDYNKYDVDLFLFEQKGEFMQFLPKEVNLLPASTNYKIFIKNRKISPLKFLLKLNLKCFYHSSIWLLKVLISKFKKEKLYIGWEHIKYFFDKLEQNYDTSISFLERKTIYYGVDKVRSKNKIAFIHNDYSIYPYDKLKDDYYFKYYNNIATVSEHCKEVLIEKFPKYKDKFLVIKNMVSKIMINKLSLEPITNYMIDKKYINIVSVGRLVNQKGFDKAIEICKKLLDNNLKIHWYIIGEGEERNNLEDLIKKYNLENNFFLIGADVNPYKWMNIADIYVQPSRFEGYGITVAEAKCLNKPIVASDIPEFRELLDNDKGLLASNIEEFTKLIEKLVNDNKLKNKMINILSNEENSLKELEKLYRIM